MNQSTKTRVRISNDIGTVEADPNMPIKPKSIIDAPQKDKTKRQHHQLAGNHRVYAPSPSSTQMPACRKELKK
ncbi:MAG: hypothetical protein ACLQVJ_14980 [Syntrophobacteraceae bacterium]